MKFFMPFRRLCFIVFVCVFHGQLLAGINFTPSGSSSTSSGSKPSLPSYFAFYSLRGGSTKTNDGKSRYEFQPVFSRPPLSGYMSYRIRVVGGEKEKKGLSLSATALSSYWDYGHSLRSSVRVEQDFEYTTKISNASTWQNFLVPIAPVERISSSYSNSYSFSVTQEGETYNLDDHSTSSSYPPFAQAISNGVAALDVDNLDRLWSTDNFLPSLFDYTHLPADWRAYHGFGSVTLTPDEWRDLSESVRRSILEYVRMGGILRLLNSSQRDENLPSLTSAKNHGLGLGVVEFVRKGGKGSNKAFQLSTSPPALQRNVEEAGKPGFFAILAVLALGVVLGPLNLFWFTRGNSEVTTTCISVLSLSLF